MVKLSERSKEGKEIGEGNKKFVNMYANAYHVNDNPDGLISLGVAENHLMDEECIEIFRKAANETFDLPDMGYGDGLTASRRLARAMSGYFNDYFNPLKKVNPEQLVFANGCTALFDQLAHVMCDEGDAILIPVPYYNAYNWDFSLRTKSPVVPVPVGPLDEGFEPDCIEVYRRTVDDLRKKGIKAKVLVVTNPHNPLGRTYPLETLLALARFAEEEDLQLIMNEIYSRSIYDNPEWPDAPPYISALSIDYVKELGGKFDMSRLHVVYGMSKDFCANGLRIGVFLSQHNEDVITALCGTGFFMKVSSMADAIWSHVLNDRKWLDWYLAENKKRLGEAATLTRAWFKERGIPVARSNAGNFMMVNLGARLDIPTDEAEQAISEKLIKAGVFLARGGSYKYPTPGWYRVTFCSDPPKLKLALERIEKALDLTPI